jgi:hypothetical protein
MDYTFRLIIFIVQYFSFLYRTHPRSYQLPIQHLMIVFIKILHYLPLSRLHRRLVASVIPFISFTVQQIDPKRITTTVPNSLCLLLPPTYIWQC